MVLFLRCVSFSFSFFFFFCIMLSSFSLLLWHIQNIISVVIDQTERINLIFVSWFLSPHKMHVPSTKWRCQLVILNNPIINNIFSKFYSDIKMIFNWFFFLKSWNPEIDDFRSVNKSLGKCWEKRPQFWTSIGFLGLKIPPFKLKT